MVLAAQGQGLVLHKAGGAIKAIPRGNGLVEGYLVSWGDQQDTDLEGQYFTPRTDYCLDWFKDRPVLYHHGLDRAIGLKSIGRIKSINPDEIGLWVQAQLDIADQYTKEVNKMLQTRQFGWSSGSVDHLVKIAPSGEILTWPIFEGSITPSPAQPHKTTVRALKSILGNTHPLFTTLRELNAEAGSKAEPTTKTFVFRGEDAMASVATKRYVAKTLKRSGIKATEEDIEAIASDLEEEALMGDEDVDVLMEDDDLDSLMSDEEDLDFLMEDDDIDPLMEDDDLDSLMEDDDIDPLMEDDDLDSLMSDDEDYVPVASRRKARRSAKTNKPAKRTSAKRRPAAKSIGLSLGDLAYIRQLEKRIKSLERMPAPGEDRVGMRGIKAVLGNVSSIKDEADRPGAYKSVFFTYMRYGDKALTPTQNYILNSRKQRFDGEEPDSVHGPVKALNTSNAASVGFAVPDDFIAELNKNVSVEAPTAAECGTRNTSSDTLRQPDLPTTDARRAYPGQARWPGEAPTNQAASQITNMSLGEIQIPIHVMLVSTTATYTSLEDVAFDLQATLSEQFAEIVAVEYETLIWGGNGSGKMRGIVNDTRINAAASTGVASVGGYLPTGKANGFTNGDVLKNMLMHLPPAYRKRAKWVGNSNTLNEVFKLKDGEGRYLWGDAQGLNQGEPTTLLNRPIVYNEFADDVAAGAFPLMFADLKRGYLIGKRVEFSVRRFDDSYFAQSDQCLFMGRMRIGGQVIQPAAFKLMKIATS